MYCYARLLNANEEGLNHTLSYIDGLGTRGAFFSELDEDLSAETVKKVLRPDLQGCLHRNKRSVLVPKHYFLRHIFKRDATKGYFARGDA